MSRVNIAVVVAHADDAELWAGGTLLNHRDAGDQIAIWYLHGITAVRRDEATRAASFLNAHVMFPADQLELVEGLAGFRPDAILTHWERDSHVDHADTFERVRTGFLKLALDHGVWPRVYSCDTYNSVGLDLSDVFQPTDIVDISPVWEQKLQLLSTYASQPVDHFSAMVERQGRLHGARTGVQFAEAFRQVSLLGACRRHRHLLVEQ